MVKPFALTKLAVKWSFRFLLRFQRGEPYKFMPLGKLLYDVTMLSVYVHLLSLWCDRAIERKSHVAKCLRGR